MSRKAPAPMQEPRLWRVQLVAQSAGLLAIVAACAVPTMGQTPGTREGGVSLGTITLSAAARADGQMLAAGTYELRLTTREAAAIPAGPPSEVNRWVEFLQGGMVRGQEIATIIPESEIGLVAKGTPPPGGTTRVDTLRDSEFIRIWSNHEGTHYLVHLARG